MLRTVNINHDLLTCRTPDEAIAWSHRIQPRDIRSKVFRAEDAKGEYRGNYLMHLVVGTHRSGKFLQYLNYYVGT